MLSRDSGGRIVACLGVLLMAAGCQSSARGPQPVEAEGVQRLSRDGDLFISGAAEPKAIEELKRRGVTAVVDMRLADQIPVGYADAVRAAGVQYVHVPIQSESLTAEQADAFVKAMSEHERESVLLQCGSANRSAAMYGLYKAWSGQCSIEEALGLARQAGMRNESLAEDVRRYVEEHPRERPRPTQDPPPAEPRP